MFGLLLHSGQPLPIQRERSPGPISFRIHGHSRQRRAREHNSLQRFRVVETSEQLAFDERVQISHSVEPSRREHEHPLANRHAHDWRRMVVDMPMVEPPLALRVEDVPHYHVSFFGASDHEPLSALDRHRRHSRPMREIHHRLFRILHWRHHDLPVPEATPRYILALVQHTDQLVESEEGPV